MMTGGTPISPAFGQAVARHDLMPFGEGISAGINGRTSIYGSAERKQQFTGKERDAESSLDFFEARYYSAAQGRFTSPDEFKGGIVDPFTGQDVETNTALPYADFTDPQTLNKYAYVRNNPLRYTDPKGHCIEDACIGEAIVVTAAATAAVHWMQSPQGQESIKAAVSLVSTGLNKAADTLGNLIFNKNTDAGKSSPPPVPTSGTAKENTNPYAGPVAQPVTVVDSKGECDSGKDG